MSDPRYKINEEVEYAGYGHYRYALYELLDDHPTLPGYHQVATVECEEDVINRIMDALTAADDTQGERTGAAASSTPETDSAPQEASEEAT